MHKSLNSFGRKRSPDERCEEKMTDSEKQQRTSTVYNNTEGSLEAVQRKEKTRRRNFCKESKKAFTWLYSSMSLTKQYFKPIHPYFSLPHLLAQFPVVNIIILSSTTDSWIVNFTIWLVKFMPT